jgi:PIN domain nuclease of toxin-antitoxin system
MNLLLDTHILLWSLLEPHRLSERAREALSGQENTLWISPITTWEIAVLAERGRIEIKGTSPAKWIRKVLGSVPLKAAPLNHEVALSSRLVDLPHQDPADRFIAATALVYDLVLLTADERLLACEAIQTMAHQ